MEVTAAGTCSKKIQVDELQQQQQQQQQKQHSGQQKSRASLIYLPMSGFVASQATSTPVAAAPATEPPVERSRILLDCYNLARRSELFLAQYPGLRGQYNLELVHCTPYLLADEKEALLSNYKAVFSALGWQEFPYTSRLDHLVPESRTPFRDLITFCWYPYCPYSCQGTRMRRMYQNIMFRDSATWFMTNKQAMLRRLLIFEAARRAAVDAGLSVSGSFDVTCSSFIPATLVYSRGREAAVTAALETDVIYIVKPATGLQGRGIELFRGGREQRDFSSFMLDRYGEAHLQSSFYVVQRYIDRPMLIRGRKFDLRIYLLVVPNMSCSVDCDTSAARRGFYAFYHPGFARLSSLEYEGGVSSDKRVHLTNCCVQLEGVTQQQQQQPQQQQQQQPQQPHLQPQETGETNWTPDQVNEYFNRRFEDGQDGIRCRDWFKTTAQADMQGIMAYVVSQFARQLVSDAHNAFRLLGCDFLLGEDGRPWLLEMNSLPSLRVRSPCHRAVKAPMQREALALAVEVAHRSANSLPVTSRCLKMRQNFRLVYSATNAHVQGNLVKAFSERLRQRQS